MQQDYPVPNEMRAEDIVSTKTGYLLAAKNAMEAGFDGVGLYGANGYLLEADTAKKVDRDLYPLYSVDEDIYNKPPEEENVNPEELSKHKEPNENDNSESANEIDFAGDKPGSDLDVPGAELDDEAEAIGREDEENNYYSLGGDNHNDWNEGQD